MTSSDHFQVLEAIGQGSFGHIRKVRRKADGVVMARKEISYAKMDVKERDQLTAEFAILSTVKHPNIVEYHHREHIKQAKMLHIYMEYCGNGDLQGMIKRCREQSTMIREEVVWAILAQLVCALYRCHYGIDPPAPDEAPPTTHNQVPPQHMRGKTVIHRDLKPENVFLGEDNSVKLGDFGLSKMMAPEEQLAMTFVGTPLYMSPELVSDTPYNNKTDIWSLGCIIYELCNLQPPFMARSPPALVQKIREGRYPPIPHQYSQELRKVIDSCLLINPHQRPETAQLLHHPMMKIYRKEREVVLFRKQLKVFEERLKMREAQLVASEREFTAKREELKRLFEESRQRLKEQLNNEVRAEWKVRAEAEIVRQVANSRMELNQRFEEEVAQRVEIELKRRIRELNLIPASDVPSLSNSSTSSTTTASPPYESPLRRKTDVHRLAPPSPPDIDMASPSHPSLGQHSPNFYERNPPNLGQNLEQYHIANTPPPLTSSAVERRAKYMRGDNDTMHDDLFDVTHEELDTLPDSPAHHHSNNNNTAHSTDGPQLARAASEGPARDRADVGGAIKRAQTTIGTNLFQTIPAKPGSAAGQGPASDEFLFARAAAWNNAVLANQNGAPQESTARGSNNDGQGDGNEQTVVWKFRAQYDGVAKWDVTAADCPSPFRKNVRRDIPMP